MRSIRASAPGKLVLAGEYAVLEGEPAVVMALDRRACVELTPAAGASWVLDAPALGIHAASGQLDGDRLYWRDSDGVPLEGLALVSVLIEQQLQHVPDARPLCLRLDTQAFFVPAGGAKLGLGSSAALAVALATALAAARGGHNPDLPELVALHRRAQGGRGSGLDVAASFSGGVLAYRRVDGQPQVKVLPWPSDLVWTCVWSGRPASTRTALETLAQWRSRQPGACAGLMQSIGEVAALVASALERGHAGAVLEGVRVSAELLARLGHASGIDIVSAGHQRLAALARRSGVAYKTSGAGGGDIGVALSDEPERLAHFIRQVTGEGFLVPDTRIDERGLQVQRPDANTKEQAWTRCG